jgi:hypothetical protein
MNAERIEEMKDIVGKVEDRLLQEMANLIDARDVPFAVSVYATALSRVIGSAIALSKSEGLRTITHEAVHMLIGSAIDESLACHSAHEAIEKASKT